MPTGSEFQDVRFTPQDQSYKQTDREMDGGLDPRIGGSAPAPSAGQYPSTFDRATPSEPSNPSYYPEEVFDRYSATGPGQSYTQTERQSVSGEYGQSDGITNPLYPGSNMVPDPVPSKQFSSKMSGNPEELCQSTMPGIQAHADLNAAFGYLQPVATLGSHPWLRDQLTNTGEKEAGNAEPTGELKVPKRKNV